MRSAFFAVLAPEADTHRSCENESTFALRATVDNLRVACQP